MSPVSAQQKCPPVTVVVIPIRPRWRLRGRALLVLESPGTGTVDTTPTNATFGKATNPGQSTNVTLPRDLQLGVKLTF